MDCLKGKHYFEDNCKNFIDIYMFSLQGLHIWTVLFQEIHICAEGNDNAGSSHVIWIFCGVF